MNRKERTIDQLVEMDTCPCEVCACQDEKDKFLDRQKLDEVCDLFANEMIDYLLENPTKYLLKRQGKQNNVE